MQRWLSVFSAVFLALVIGGAGLIFLHHRAKAWEQRVAEWLAESKQHQATWARSRDEGAANGLYMHASRGSLLIKARPVLADDSAVRSEISSLLLGLNLYRNSQGLPPYSEADLW